MIYTSYNFFQKRKSTNLIEKIRPANFLLVCFSSRSVAFLYYKRI